MDGNGRWAQARRHSRVFGHVRGAQVAKKIIESCSKLRIKNLTLFTFSTENWNRSKEEVSFLMHLLVRQLQRETQMLVKNNIRFRCIGDLSRLPEQVQAAIRKTVTITSSNTGMNLVFALNYGGRQEIVQAVQSISQLIAKGQISPQDVDQNLISNHLPSSFLPDPDLIVRTSGEYRLSNFFLWQAAYSEFVFVDKLWPDFNEKDLHDALEEYSSRIRRFGQTTEQVQQNNMDKKNYSASIEPALIN